MVTRREEQMEVLKQLCTKGNLPKTREVVEQDDVVMENDGSFSFASSNDKKSALQRRRKELVLGLNGFDQHSLSEANDIIQTQRSSPVSRIRDFFSRQKI